MILPMNRIIDIPINQKIQKISWIFLISWLGMLITISCANSEEQIAKPISGETFFHGNFDLDMHVGKPVLINFWFPSCPPCRAEMPDLQIAFEKYGEDVAFIGIQQMGSDSEKMGIEFIRELGLTYPVMADFGSKVQANYEILSFPTTVFLRKDHSISRVWTGIIDEQQLNQELDAILGI